MDYQSHIYLSHNPDMWTHLHWAGITRMKISASLHPHYRYFKEIKTLGKTPLYQRSLECLTRLCMTSVCFHFFSLSLYHLFFMYIVYNRGARLALACFDTPSWWSYLVNENLGWYSIYARAGRKMKSARVGVQPFFLKNPKQKNNGVIISERLI